jgi:CDGSH-type Zn-finger protein
MVSIYFAIFEPKIKSTMSKTKLIINSNGSIKIEGDFEIMDCEVKYMDRRKNGFGSCRCGLSSNKPL